MRLAFFILTISSLLIGSANAGVVNYGSFPGVNFAFNNVFETSSSIPTPFANLYGAPTSMGNMLIFQPKLFEAARNTVGSTTSTSQLSVSLLANPGFVITGFSVEEFGDYGIGVPFAGGSGSVGASLSGTLSSPSGSVTSASIPGVTSFNQTSSTPPGITGANWNLNIAPTSLLAANYAPTASLLVNNSLTANVNAGITDSFIKKKGFKVTVSTAPGGGNIPEPTSALVFLAMGAAGIPLYRRR